MSGFSLSRAGRIGSIGLLAIAFIVLKLTGVITWPWVWVLSPFWIAFLIVIVFFGSLFGMIVWTYAKYSE